MSVAKVSCPHLGNYYIALGYFFRNGLKTEYIDPPPITSRTFLLGSGVSPSDVCMPFKTTLGSYLEAIEMGADTLVATGGVCRLNFFGELQEQILKDLGKDIKFIDLQPNYLKPRTILKSFRAVNPSLRVSQMLPAFFIGLKIAEGIDKVQTYINANYAFVKDRTAMLDRNDKYLSEIGTVKTRKEAAKITIDCMRDLKEMPMDKPENPIKIGILGEFYTLLDAASNHNIEYQLAEMGAEVHRFLNVSNSLIHYPAGKINRLSRPYMRKSAGVTTRLTVGTAMMYVEAGYDGIIHVKSFGCMPEVDATPILQNVSNDKNIPLLCLSYDELTEAVGLRTRLEAFYDMLSMRRS